MVDILVLQIHSGRPHSSSLRHHSFNTSVVCFSRFFLKLMVTLHPLPPPDSPDIYIYIDTDDRY